MAGILGYVQLSLRKLEPESALHNNLKIVEKETKRCRTIIDNLLKFTRQEKVAQEPTDVNQVAEDTAMLVDHQLGMHRIRLEKALAEGLPRIVGNANQLQQVLLNIILNAEQAMEGNPGTVRIETEGKDGMVEIRVRDTGPGIPKEIQAGSSSPSSRRSPRGRDGAGLSVSYGIVKDHKGDIIVDSEPGKGACFILRIRRRGPKGSLGRMAAAGAGGRCLMDEPRARILVADARRRSGGPCRSSSRKRDTRRTPCRAGRRRWNGSPPGRTTC